MRITPLVGAATVLTTLGVQAANLSVIGTWAELIGAPDVIGGAGQDIRSPIESNPWQATIAITNSGGLPWTLLVSRTAASLPTGVTLAVRRTGDGSCGTLTGGLDYQGLGDQGQVLFAGQGDCNGIGIQLRLAGVSIRQAPGQYGTTVLYSLQ